jgi:hypothetical protein
LHTLRRIPPSVIPAPSPTVGEGGQPESPLLYRGWADKNENKRAGGAGQARHACNPMPPRAEQALADARSLPPPGRKVRAAVVRAAVVRAAVVRAAVVTSGCGDKWLS